MEGTRGWTRLPTVQIPTVQTTGKIIREKKSLGKNGRFRPPHDDPRRSRSRTLEYLRPEHYSIDDSDTRGQDLL